MAKTAKTLKSLVENKDALLEVSSNVHDEVLNTTNFVIDETINTLSRVQRIAGKAIKKSEPLMEKQIEMAFSTADSIKSQAVKSGKRALKLVGMTRTFNKWTKNIAEAVESIPTAEEVVDSAKDYVANAKSDVEKVISKATNTVKAESKSTKIKVKASANKASKSSKKVVKTIKKAATAKTAPVKNKKLIKPTTAKAVKAVKKASTAAAATTKKTVSKVKATKVAKTMTSELVQLKGIGASVAQKMIVNDIKSIDSLKNAPIATLEKIKLEAGPRFKNFDVNLWVEAAKSFKK